MCEFLCVCVCVVSLCMRMCVCVCVLLASVGGSQPRAAVGRLHSMLPACCAGAKLVFVWVCVCVRAGCHPEIVHGA